MLFCYGHGSPDTAFTLSLHWDREIKEAVGNLEEALSTDSSDTSDEEDVQTPKAESSLSNSLQFPLGVNEAGPGRAYFVEEENGSDTQNNLYLESEPTPHRIVFQAKRKYESISDNLNESSMRMNLKIADSVDTPRSSEEYL